jgi:hypothetical protein
MRRELCVRRSAMLATITLAAILTAIEPAQADTTGLTYVDVSGLVSGSLLSRDVPYGYFIEAVTPNGPVIGGDNGGPGALFLNPSTGEFGFGFAFLCVGGIAPPPLDGSPDIFCLQNGQFSGTVSNVQPNTWVYPSGYGTISGHYDVVNPNGEITFYTFTEPAFYQLSLYVSTNCASCDEAYVTFPESSAIPEPPTAYLAGTGLAAAALLAERRRRRIRRLNRNTV